MNKYEVAVIGGGPGGYVSAIQAAKYGKKVALIEADEMGGTCLNRGCIPSKTLLRHTEVIESIKKAENWGIYTSDLTFSFSKMLERKDMVIKRLRNGINYLLKQGKIDVIKGYGEIQPNNRIKIKLKNEDILISAEKIIVATGSRPFIPPIRGLEDTNYYTSDTIFNIHSIPKSMVIIGGGVIGVEFACIFSALGVDITIVEAAERIIPNEDFEVSNILAQSLKKKGVKIITKTRVLRINENLDTKSIILEREGEEFETLETNDILISVGRLPNTSAVSQLNLKMSGHFIQVDEHMKTSNPSIYAVGDVVGGWQLAHVASAEGKVAASNASGFSKNVNYKVVPRCIYTSPEIASVGITEEEAKNQKIDYSVLRVDNIINGKALALDETEGFVKLIAEKKYGEILGVTMVGANVTEIISEPSAFIHLEGTVEDIASMIHSHPSMAETIFETAGSWLEKYNSHLTQKTI